MVHLFPHWNWQGKEGEIIKYINTLEQKYGDLTIKLNHREEILQICPFVRGKAFTNVLLPDWFQTEDYGKLGEDFANYCLNEALPSRRR